MRELLFEEVLEGLAGVAVPWRRRRAAVGAGLLLRVGGWRGVLLHRGAKFVKGAVVACVLGGNALWNRLRALELRAGVEETALFAAVELEIALGTLAVGVEAVAEHRAAIGAACARYSADHARCAGSELIGGAWAASGRLAIVPLALFLLF